jgi:phosphatidylglycerophosphate synthase
MERSHFPVKGNFYMETISELRAICQKRKTQYYTSPWASIYIHRVVSIYFTRLFLVLGASANQATLTGFIFGMAGSTLLIFSQPVYWIIATFLLWLYVVIDHSDGEVARYRKASSPFGRYMDEIGGTIVRLYYFACLSIGVYNAVSYDKVLMIGLIVVIFSSVYYLSNMLPSQILYESKNIKLADSQKNNSKNLLSFLLELGRNIMSLETLGFLWVGITAVIDYFVPAWTIKIPALGTMMLDARAIFFYLFSLALFINGFLGIILKGRYIKRSFLVSKDT